MASDKVGVLMRQAGKVALVAAAIIALAQEAPSATIRVHEPDGEGRVFVDIVGTINDEDFKTFKEKTDQFYLTAFGHPKKQVIVTLVSYGGKAYPALQIGDRIRKGGMSDERKLARDRLERFGRLGGCLDLEDAGLVEGRPRGEDDRQLKKHMPRP